jgi:hypothetical protein
MLQKQSSSGGHLGYFGNQLDATMVLLFNVYSVVFADQNLKPSH